MAAGYLDYPFESNNSKPGYAIIVSDDGSSGLKSSVQLDSNKLPGKLSYLVPFFSDKSVPRTNAGGNDWIYELMIKGIVLQATRVTKGELSMTESFHISKVKGLGPRNSGTGAMKEMKKLMNNFQKY
ncbi:hypothetical protein V496_08713 [Pseudogymnoascus sp. VKM F-4515 (FW-2607)]|nr:hypothetical protein V496_08713 [Pseudogymnoascus sp. VKM F-4515 (FW-2607)]KFY99515.1 hypothetical protein V498_00713 [Pseudogymnoascus sp. VKM F-4517 (FW-2822)]